MNLSDGIRLSKITEIYEKIFSENDNIYIMDGDLNPVFYEQSVSSIKPNASVNLICDSLITTEDELFKKYHNIQQNHLGYWWFAKRKNNWHKAHPLFEELYGEDNFRVNVLSEREGLHFLIGLDTNDVLVKAVHDELEIPGATIYLGDRNAAESYLGMWYSYRSSAKPFDETAIRIFKPRSVIESELKIEKRLKKEFSNLGKCVVQDIL